MQLRPRSQVCAWAAAQDRAVAGQSLPRKNTLAGTAECERVCSNARALQREFVKNSF